MKRKILLLLGSDFAMSYTAAFHSRRHFAASCRIARDFGIGLAADQDGISALRHAQQHMRL